MSTTSQPRLAREHLGLRGSKGVHASTLLVVYLVLLLAIPSNVRIGALGSIGRPSVIWGLFLLMFWAATRLQKRNHDVRPLRQPIRFAFAALLVVALVSLAAALLRGQPLDQISPAFTGIIRLLSWAGVLFVTLDGIRTMNDFTRLARLLVVAAGLLAALGIAQVMTKLTLVDFWGSIPGLLATAEGGIVERSGLVRASGTAYHPLEYATSLIAVFPIAIAAAISHGFHWRHKRFGWGWWLVVGLITVSALIGVSRSAIVGFVFVLVAMLPVLPRRYRGWIFGGGLALGALVALVIPGIINTTLALFTGAGTDSSTLSRVGGLDRAPEFIATSPFIGAGFGTFLPRYYIFDNQWVMIAVELGILGTAAFAGIFLTSIWSAAEARRVSVESDVKLLGYSLIVSMLAVAILFAFFDGLAFPIAAGLLFFLAGLCGALRNIGLADAAIRRPRLGRLSATANPEPPATIQGPASRANGDG